MAMMKCSNYKYLVGHKNGTIFLKFVTRVHNDTERRPIDQNVQ